MTANAHEHIAHANAWLDGWRDAVDQPEHPRQRIDVGGHSASWLSGYRAGIAATHTRDTGLRGHVYATDDIDDACDVIACQPTKHEAPTPNARALLHVIERHPRATWDRDSDPASRTPVTLDAELAHAHERALLRSNTGTIL